MGRKNKPKQGRGSPGRKPHPPDPPPFPGDERRLLDIAAADDARRREADDGDPEADAPVRGHPAEDDASFTDQPRESSPPDAAPSKPMSSTRRAALFALASVHVVLCSGSAYGWTALRPVLKHAAFFASSDPAEQSRRLNVMSTAGIAANALCKLPLGFVLDKGGPRVTAVIGGAMVAAGSAVIALGDRQSVAQMASAYFLVGVAGPFVQMPCFQFCELYGPGKGTAMSQLVTCFELSTGVFEVMRWLDASFDVAFERMFLGYAVVGVFVLVTALAYWPDVPHKPPPPPPEVNVPQEHAEEEEEEEEDRERRAELPEDLEEDLHSAPLARQLLSGPFFLAATFTAVHIFRQGFLLATVGPRAETFFDADRATFLADAFSVILPLGFLPMALLTATGAAGAILSRPDVAFAFVNVISMAYGLALLIPDWRAYMALFILFPLARQFVFSTFFSYTAGTFGYKSFGRISGVASTFAGLVQLAMSTLIDRVERGGAPFPPRAGAKDRWRAADLALGAVPIVLMIQPVAAIVARRREERREREEKERGVLAEVDEELAEPLVYADRGPGAYPGARPRDITRQASHISIVSMAGSMASSRGTARGSLAGADKWDVYASSHASPAMLSGSYLQSAGRWSGTPDSSGFVGANFGGRRRETPGGASGDRLAQMRAGRRDSYGRDSNRDAA